MERRAGIWYLEGMGNLFKDAWHLARQGAKRFGGSSRVYFACALRLVIADRAKARLRAGRPVARLVVTVRNGVAVAARVVVAALDIAASSPISDQSAVEIATYHDDSMTTENDVSRQGWMARTRALIARLIGRP